MTRCTPILILCMTRRWSDRFRFDRRGHRVGSEEGRMTKPISLDADTKLSAAPGALSTSLPDEAVILDSASGRYFGLDGVGARVWELVSASITWSTLLTTIIDEYDVAAERAEHDLRALLADLAARELLILDDAHM